MPGAGELRHRIGFFKRPSQANAYGNPEGEFPDTPEFELFGKLAQKFGGEAIQAARLQGTATATITVRQNSKSEQVTTDWMAKDMNEGTIWNIRSGPVDPDDSRAFYEFLVQSGVAA